MKALVILILGMGIIFGCKSDNISPSQLTGKWNHTYSVKNKDANGNWGEWHTIYTLVALPSLEFTKDGKILWDGEFVDNCCKSNKFTLKNDKNILITIADKDCEKTNCFPCSTWNILKLTEKTLEIETCEVASRYERAN